MGDILKVAQSMLLNKAGAYGFQNIKTGEIVYVGSAVNLWVRFYQHITGKKSNQILQNAFAKYGLAQFRFLVFEIIPDYKVIDNSNTTHKSPLLAVEQLYLDSFKPRYNLLTVAGSLQGYKHTPESLAKMSGENNPMFGKSQENSPTFGRTGALHPMFGKKGADAPNFGKTPANAKPVYLYDTKKELIREFNSQDQCARWLNVFNQTVTRYISSGKVLNNQYLLTYSLY
jgi:group I intron endonuclease